MKKIKKEKHTCEECSEDVEKLVTLQGFIMTHFVTWVCKDCYKELENEEWVETVEEKQDEV